MSEFTQTKLGTYLGIWKYSSGRGVKYYSATPQGDDFVIRWGKTLDEVKTRKEYIQVSDSSEIYRRILSKARGGFTLRTPIGLGEWTRKCHDEYDTIAEVLQLEKDEARKRKPRKRKLSLLDWVGGMEEYRENGQE